jgi:exopolyphosphatase/guanosine-5'-triphosphate,3'-diphosphate pyrophosphatase
VLCAAIDIGSNTTRLLVAEPVDGRLKATLEQRAYTRVGKGTRNGRISDEKVAEVADVVTTQVRLARELGAERIRPVATAAIREAINRDEVVEAIEAVAGVNVEILSEEEEGRLAFVGATKTLGHPVDGEVAVVDVGGGSCEVIHGTVAEGVGSVRSFAVGSGSLADELLADDPPSPAELRELRERISELFSDVELSQPDQAVAVGGSASSMRRLVGAVLEYETLERAMRVLAGGEIAEVARRFELDPQRVRILPAGVLLLEKFSQLLGAPLQIGKGGLREGVVLDMLNGGTAGAAAEAATA